MLMIIADGVWWRRALDPQFKPASVLPLFMDITRHMLRSRPQLARTAAANDATPAPRVGREEGAR
jgi:hypothetical protein